MKLGRGKVFRRMRMTEEEQDVRAMMSRLDRYLMKKGLELKVGKTKVIRFKKRRGRSKKIDWQWEK